MIKQLDSEYYRLCNTSNENLFEEVYFKINEIIEKVNSLEKQDDDKKKDNTLYVCPYDKVVGCAMTEGCKDCEIFSESLDVKKFDDVFGKDK